MWLMSNLSMASSASLGLEKAFRDVFHIGAISFFVFFAVFLAVFFGKCKGRLQKKGEIIDGLA